MSQQHILNAFRYSERFSTVPRAARCLPGCLRLPGRTLTATVHAAVAGTKSTTPYRYTVRATTRTCSATISKSPTRNYTRTRVVRQSAKITAARAARPTSRSRPTCPLLDAVLVQVELAGPSAARERHAVRGRWSHLVRVIQGAGSRGDLRVGGLGYVGGSDRVGASVWGWGRGQGSRVGARLRPRVAGHTFLAKINFFEAGKRLTRTRTRTLSPSLTLTLTLSLPHLRPEGG